MKLTTLRDGTILRVTLDEERLDALSAAAFRQELQDGIVNGSQKIVVDLSRTVLVDSSGLGALVSVLRKLSGPGSLVLHGVTPPVERALRLARLDRILVVEPAGATQP